MSQERLNGLVILSIEQDLLENIEYKSLINIGSLIQVGYKNYET